jgi:hypothetical protein
LYSCQLFLEETVRKILSLSILLAVTGGASAQEASIPMQKILDGGAKIVTSIEGRLIFQKGNQVFSCAYDISGPQQTVAGYLIRTSYLCVPLH